MAARAGAALTATRLNVCFTVLQMDEIAYLPGLDAKPARDVAANLQYKYAGKTGACAFFSHLEVVPVVQQYNMEIPKPYTDYEGPVMHEYGASLALSPLNAGPLHLAFDGVQLKRSGEINLYVALCPPRPGVGVKETTGWLPLQVATV